MLLGILGAKPIEQPYLGFGEISTIIYFYFIFILLQIENLDTFLLFVTNLILRIKNMYKKI